MGNEKENSLKDMFEKQASFAKNFYDVETMTESEREQMTVKFAAALHTEVSSLLSGVNFETHRPVKHEIDRNNIVHESVDVWRYLQAIMNVWKVSPDEFLAAYDARDKFLSMRHKMESKKWEGQPVLVVDVDDVISEFRRDFLKWIKKENGIHVDENSEEYYATKEIAAAGHSPDALFMNFIEARQLKTLSSDFYAIEAINTLYDEGYWIHLLTARPAENLTCKYDTYAWIHLNNVKCHRITLEPEKFLWLSRTEYFKEKKVICAIDDSPKHAAEYAKHGVKCLAPRKSYNKSLDGIDNVFVYDTPGYVVAKIKILAGKMNS